MSSNYQTTPSLTDEQRRVVDQPVDALVLVTAAAGSGKTHTLVRRIDRLVSEEGLDSGEILVLSFSRASVRELRHRLVKNGRDTSRITARTFDSWALDLLLEVRGSEPWQERPFAERIRAAAEEIIVGNLDARYEHDLRHVVIDEVQDLVGDRRELVECLLERYDCGFTVVGDSAQAIYGFQVEDEEQRAGETDRFVDWLRTTFEEELVELHLSRNFRAKSDDARVALSYGETLRSAVTRRMPDGADHYADLRTVLLGVDDLGSFEDELVRSGLRTFPTTSAVLCRTNGQALVVSEWLHQGDVGHRIQRSAQDRVVPAWVASLFGEAPSQRISQEDFEDIVKRSAQGDIEDMTELWRPLARVAGDRTRSALDLRRLRSTIAAERMPDEITAQPPAKFIVSSFHRAKGLEFDRVIVIDPGPLPKDTSTVDAAESARALYVAMTRSRDEIWRHDPLKSWTVRLDKRIGRWARYGRRPWQRLGLEFLGADVERQTPAGTLLFKDDPKALQEYLARSIVPTDEVVCERIDTADRDQGSSPRYLIIHRERPIGVTSDKFGADLYRHLKQGRSYEPRNFPRRIVGIRIDSVETVVGSEAAGEHAGLGSHGVWLAPRLGGLSRFQWNDGNEIRSVDE